MLGNFEDNSTDTSDDQQIAANRTKPTSKANAMGEVEGDHVIKIDKLDSNNAAYTEREKSLLKMVKDCDKTEHSTTIRNDITPPPGIPKIENTARLRRYRHNVD